MHNHNVLYMCVIYVYHVYFISVLHRYIMYINYINKYFIAWQHIQSNYKPCIVWNYIIIHNIFQHVTKKVLYIYNFSCLWIKYLGVGYSVRMQNQDKSFSPFLLCTLQSAQDFHWGMRPELCHCFPGSPLSVPKVRDVRAQPHLASREGGRVSHLSRAGWEHHSHCLPHCPLAAAVRSLSTPLRGPGDSLRWERVSPPPPFPSAEAGLPLYLFPGVLTSNCPVPEQSVKRVQTLTWLTYSPTLVPPSAAELFQRFACFFTKCVTSEHLGKHWSRAQIYDF